MARSTQKGTTPVDAIQHLDKRINIPTADAQIFISPEVEEVRKVRYTRDESLDPQLVWRGKYPATPEEAAGHDNDLIVDAPPIYIQEKIDPRILIENLRCTTAKSQDEPELTLFDNFDGLDEFQSVEYYQHAANWSNRMILGDSLQVMASLADREKLRGQVQMIYIDPPYGIKFASNWQVSTRKRTVRDGNLDDAVREVEQIKAFRDTWELGIHSYLSYLRDRLIVARELLTESGSCFVQIGDENVHLVRSLMDEVFGSENFVATIDFKKTGGFTSDALPRNVDYIHWYAKSAKLVKFRRLYQPVQPEPSDTAFYDYAERPDGQRRPLSRSERAAPSKISDKLLARNPLSSDGTTTDGAFAVEFDGSTFTPASGTHWKTNLAGMMKLRAAKRLIVKGRTLRYVRYWDDFAVDTIGSLWLDTVTGGFRGDDRWYVVQTVSKAIARCVLMTTDPGDLVVDPTCGSGTTAFVAEQWGRRWITIDTSRVALALARQRIMSARYPWYLLSDSPEGRAKEQLLVAQTPTKSDFANDIRQGFVYERTPHVTLRSIANNPDIKDGMTHEQIDAAVRRHADFELLYDRPFEDPRKVRVAGPFTVESLSPHRSLSFRDAPEPRSEAEAAKDADSPDFEQTILDNLAAAGIQNGKRAEKLRFASFESYAGSYIQAVGQQATSGDDAAPSRIAIAIGPQYGTVSPSWVKRAAREALRADGVDLLAILGFAFDPQVTSMEAEEGVDVEASDDGFANVAGIRKLGRLPVLMVRMNADLLMGEELKKTGAGNLFTVFGEPDIDLRETPEGWIVDLKGVDVYDPTTGEIRSNDTGQIALWMIDTDYNEESFFVRHCYFTGGNDPYKRLKTALKADINEEAWETLYRTVSRPFPKPETGKIAVKVINDYGDEVMKVFEVP